MCTQSHMYPVALVLSLDMLHLACVHMLDGALYSLLGPLHKGLELEMGHREYYVLGAG